MVGTFKNQNEELENHVQSLKKQVEQLSLTDPNFSIATKLGKLSVKDLELKTLQEYLTKAKQDVLEKEKLLNDSLTN